MIRSQAVQWVIKQAERDNHFIAFKVEFVQSGASVEMRNS